MAQTVETTKPSKAPLIVGIVAAAIACWFLVVTALCFITASSMTYGSSGCTVNTQTLDLKTQQQVTPDPVGSKPLILRTTYNISASAGSEIVNAELMNMFGLVNAPQPMYTRITSVDSSPQAPLTAAAVEQIQSQNQQAQESLEAQAIADYENFARTCGYYNLTFTILFALIGWLWIARYRHLKHTGVKSKV